MSTRRPSVWPNYTSAGSYVNEGRIPREEVLCRKFSSGGRRNCARVQASPLPSPQTKYKICSEDGWSIAFFRQYTKKGRGTHPPSLSATHNPSLSCEITERKSLVITCGHCCVVRNESWTGAVELSDPDTEFICH